MKKQLWRILSLLILSFSGQAQVSFADLQLAAGDQWSFPGGVFQPAGQPPMVSQPGEYKLLIKPSSGAVSLRMVRLAAGTAAVIDKTLLVDRSGPVITPEWHHVLRMDDEIKTGPDSSLQLQLGDGAIKSMALDGQLYPADDGVIRFKQPVAEVSVVAVDDFGNLTAWQQTVVSDFEPPQISWQLQAPALKLANQWHAGKSALAQLDVNGNNPLRAIQLNGTELSSTEQALTVRNGDVVQVTDVLGNSQQQTISWVQDESAPVLSLTVGELPHAETSMVRLKVNELLSVTTVDQGVGLATQQYQGKSKRWQSLPKKFRFLNKGRYSIKVKSIDAVGNELVQTIQVKVKR